MKKILAVLGVLSLLMVIVVSAQAHVSRIKVTGTGYAQYNLGGPCTGCGIDIQNGTTGAKGSTITDGSGNFHVNMVNADQYAFRVDTCKVHSLYVGSWSQYVYGTQYALPSISANPVGGC